jgi:hypothetical protein
MMFDTFKKLLGGAALNALIALPAVAADFIPGGDEDLGCILTVRGPIVAGDAKAFRSALDQVVGDAYGGGSDFLDRLDGANGLPVPRICLDSPGGSLTEALDMTDVLTNRKGDSEYLYSAIGTAVAADALCHSACAVLFMAGGSQSESSAGRLPNRVLHAKGSLGFHAPGLSVADGNYTAESVDRAFAIAVRSIGVLSERQTVLRFPDTLLNRMVSTPPSEMYVLTTVGEASQWMIDIAGLPYPAKPGPNHFVNLCLNAQPALRPSTGYTQSYVKRHDGPGTDFFAGHGLGDEDVAQVFGYYGTGKADINLGSGGDFGDAYFNSDPEEATEGGLNCEVSFNGRWPIQKPLRSNLRRFYISFANGGIMALDQAALYPPWTRFAELAGAHGTSAIPANATIWSAAQDFGTNCFVYNSNDRLSDKEPCRATETVSFMGDGAAGSTIVFTWPSGSRTTISQRGYDLSINGNRARGDYISGASDQGANVTCLRNSASGNAFCYERTASD